MRPVAPIALFLLLQGCDVTGGDAKKRAPTSHAAPHRFALASKFSIDLAFDTQTGQLCRTWDWKPLGETPSVDVSGNIPQRKIGEFTPTCVAVYEKYPSGSGGIQIEQTGDDGAGESR
jgi:hypothetical protein